MELTAGEWRQALELPEEETPDVVIVEGSWWREQRTRQRLGYLHEVRELKFPDIFWGRWSNKKVVFCCAYGAARTVEIIHLFGILGAKLAVQIGTCGGLQAQLKPGDIVLPQVAICREGVAQIYGALEAVAGSAEWIERAQRLLKQRGHQTYSGLHLTWATLFGQTGRMIETWQRAGYLAVDMETATTFAVADYFQMPAVSMLVVWDDLTRNRTFLEPLPAEEQAALERSNQAVFETALALAEQL
jgi:purine-nucleoside phosphorylase